MNIAVACGGTGGHIFPGLATARALEKRGHRVTLWLAGRDVEACSVDGWQGNTVKIRGSGFPSGGVSVRGLVSAFRLALAAAGSWRVMRRERPDVLLCMGSYASVGPCLAARLCGVPVVLHEANAIPGRAISFLARFATRICAGFEAALPFFAEGKASVTGFPLREGFSVAPRITEQRLFSLLVMGGSQGAHVLNDRMPLMVQALRKNCGFDVRVIHLAGMRDADSVEKQYRSLGIPAEVHSFTANMAQVYASADLAIARSGAATCTELAICGVPAVLVPLPSAPRNHQMLNAQAMAAGGGMRVVPESDFTMDNMVPLLQALVSDPSAISVMRRALAHSVPADGAGRLADVVESVLQER